MVEDTNPHFWKKSATNKNYFIPCFLSTASCSTNHSLRASSRTEPLTRHSWKTRYQSCQDHQGSSNFSSALTDPDTTLFFLATGVHSFKHFRSPGLSWVVRNTCLSHPCCQSRAARVTHNWEVRLWWCQSANMAVQCISACFFFKHEAIKAVHHLLDTCIGKYVLYCSTSRTYGTRSGTGKSSIWHFVANTLLWQQCSFVCVCWEAPKSVAFGVLGGLGDSGHLDCAKKLSPAMPTSNFHHSYRSVSQHSFLMLQTSPAHFNTTHFNSCHFYLITFPILT